MAAYLQPLIRTFPPQDRLYVIPNLIGEGFVGFKFCHPLIVEALYSHRSRKCILGILLQFLHAHKDNGSAVAARSAEFIGSIQHNTLTFTAAGVDIVCALVTNNKREGA